MTTQEQWRLARLVQRVYAEGDMAVVLALLAYDFRQWCNSRPPSPVDPPNPGETPDDAIDSRSRLE